MGREDVEAGHLNLAEIFCSNASPPDICGRAEKLLNINTDMLLGKSPQTVPANFLISHSLIDAEIIFAPN